MKVAVIGGGSTYTPELVEGFGLRQGVLPVEELVLHDIDQERLDVVGGLAERILRKLEFPGRLTTTTDRRGGDRGRGLRARPAAGRRPGGAADGRDDPAQVRLIGQETTGAGGFAKALRTVPVVLEIAEDTARLGAPGAWLLDFTNPAGLVTQGLIDHGHRAIGLCNIPIGFQRELAKQLGVEPERVQLEHVGLNHLSWERKVLVDGEDRLPGLIDTYSDQLGEEVDLPGELVRLNRALPSYYLRYFYLTSDVVAKQATEKSRASEVMEIEAGLLEMYADPGAGREAQAARAARRRLLLGGGGDAGRVAAHRPRRRPGGQRAQRRGDPQHGRRRRRRGGVPDRPEGRASAARRPVAAGVAGTGRGRQGVRAADRAAAVEGDRDLALKALIAHPLVADYRLAKPLLEELLAANRALLPRFAA